MDSNKVIIMEVKDDYAIVMTSDFGVLTFGFGMNAI